MTVRPLRLLLLNPKKEKLTVHSCRGLLELGPFPSRSMGYFVGTDFDKVRAEQFDPLIVIDPEGAQRVEMMFLFPHVQLGTSDSSHKGEKWQASFGKPEVQCEDQAGRTLRTSTSTVITSPKPPKAARAPKPSK